MKSYGLELVGSLTVQGVLTLPVWDSSYTKKLVFCEDDEHLYYSTTTGWVDLYALDASRITSGSFGLSVIPNLPASKITSGEIDKDLITSVNASAIVGTISPTNMPVDVYGSFTSVDNDAARFALTAPPVGLGDTVYQKDTGVMYYIIDLAHLDDEDGYASVSSAVSRINKSTTPVILLSVDCNGTKIFTNTGSIGTVGMYLPYGADGYKLNAIVTTAQPFTFIAKETEVIRYLNTVSKIGGSITSSTIGNKLQLEWSGTQWIADVLGTWQLETS